MSNDRPAERPSNRGSPGPGCLPQPDRSRRAIRRRGVARRDPGGRLWASRISYRLHPDQMSLAAGVHGAHRCRRASRDALFGRSRGDRARPTVQRHDAPLRALKPIPSGAEGPPPCRNTAIPGLAWRWHRRCGGQWRQCWRHLPFPETGFGSALQLNGLLAIQYVVSRVFDPGESGRSLEDHGSAGQSPEDGREVVTTL